MLMLLIMILILRERLEKIMSTIMIMSMNASE